MNRKSIILTALILLTSSLQLLARNFPEGAPHPDAFCDGRKVCEYKGALWLCLKRDDDGKCVRIEKLIGEKPPLKAFHAGKNVVIYKGKCWRCDKRDDYGRCVSFFPTSHKVSKSKVPDLSLFDGPLNTRKNIIAYNGELWKCTSRNIDTGACENAVKME